MHDKVCFLREYIKKDVKMLRGGKDNVICDTREKLLVTYYKVYMID